MTQADGDVSPRNCGILEGSPSQTCIRGDRKDHPPFISHLFIGHLEGVPEPDLRSPWLSTTYPSPGMILQVKN